MRFFTTWLHADSTDVTGLDTVRLRGAVALGTIRQVTDLALPVPLS